MYKNKEITNIIIHPQTELIMFALIFLYGLIISVILGAVILVLKIIGFLLMSIVTALGFFLHWLGGKIYRSIFPRRERVCRN